MAGIIKNKKKVGKTVHFSDFKKEHLVDLEVAVLYLNEALLQHDSALFSKCLSEVIQINGGLAGLAKLRSTSRQNIHKVLAKKGGPKLETLNDFLAFVDLQLTVKKIG